MSWCNFWLFSLPRIYNEWHIIHTVVDYKIFQDVKRSTVQHLKITTPIYPVKVLPVKHCQNLETKLFFKTLCFKLYITINIIWQKYYFLFFSSLWNHGHSNSGPPFFFPTNEIARNKICSVDLLNGHEWRKIGYMYRRE